jgi:hypothetical protein
LIDDSANVLWTGNVRRSEPLRLLSYTFDVTGSSEPPTEVPFELSPPVSPIAQGSHVLLCITSRGMREVILKGHLDLLLLAALQAGPSHDAAIAERLLGRKMLNWSVAKRLVVIVAAIIVSASSLLAQPGAFHAAAALPRTSFVQLDIACAQDSTSQTIDL